MWVQQDWEAYFERIKDEFDIVVDIWCFMTSIPSRFLQHLPKKKIVIQIGLDKTSKRQGILVSAAIHRMEDDGLISVDRSIYPYSYQLNPYAISQVCKRIGRVSCKEIVRVWRKEYPDNTSKSKCARKTGLSYSTVRKWWGD